MDEESLLEKLQEMRKKKFSCEKYSDEWAMCCFEIGKLTSQIWRVRRESK